MFELFLGCLVVGDLEIGCFVEGDLVGLLLEGFEELLFERFGVGLVVEGFDSVIILLRLVV